MLQVAEIEKQLEAKEVLLLQRQLEKLGQNSSTGGGWEGPGKGIEGWGVEECCLRL